MQQGNPWQLITNQITKEVPTVYLDMILILSPLNLKHCKPAFYSWLMSSFLIVLSSPPTCHLIGQAHAVSWHKGVGLEMQTYGPSVAVEVRYRAFTGAELMGLAVVSLERERERETEFVRI